MAAVLVKVVARPESGSGRIRAAEVIVNGDVFAEVSADCFAHLVERGSDWILSEGGDIGHINLHLNSVPVDGDRFDANQLIVLSIDLDPCAQLSAMLVDGLEQAYGGAAGISTIQAQVFSVDVRPLFVAVEDRLTFVAISWHVRFLSAAVRRWG